jgi:hypothetical protein
MSIQLNGAEIGEIVGIAASVFSILLMLVCGWFVYLMVRPPRHVREQRRRDREERPGELEEMWRLMDRLDSRLEVLERAMVEAERPERIFHRQRRDEEDRLLSPAEEGRESGGTK